MTDLWEPDSGCVSSSPESESVSSNERPPALAVVCTPFSNIGVEHDPGRPAGSCTVESSVADDWSTEERIVLVRLVTPRVVECVGTCVHMGTRYHLS